MAVGVLNKHAILVSQTKTRSLCIMNELTFPLFSFFQAQACRYLRSSLQERSLENATHTCKAQVSIPINILSSRRKSSFSYTFSFPACRKAARVLLTMDVTDPRRLFEGKAFLVRLNKRTDTDKAKLYICTAEASLARACSPCILRFLLFQLLLINMIITLSINR